MRRSIVLANNDHFLWPAGSFRGDGAAGKLGARLRCKAFAFRALGVPYDVPPVWHLQGACFCGMNEQRVERIASRIQAADVVYRTAVVRAEGVVVLRGLASMLAARGDVATAACVEAEIARRDVAAAERASATASRIRKAEREAVAARDRAHERIVSLLADARVCLAPAVYAVARLEILATLPPTTRDVLATADERAAVMALRTSVPTLAALCRRYGLAHPDADRPPKPSGRYVVELPLRFSAADERRAFARVRTAQAVANEILAEYLARAQRYLRDPDRTRLLAEVREARRDGRKTARVSETPKMKRARTPRGHDPVFAFTNEADRNAAWNALRERHGLIGETPNAKLTESGLASRRATAEWISAIAARLRGLGDAGLDGKTLQHEIAVDQRDRVLTWCGIKPRAGAAKKGKPSFASRRSPVTSVTGSSSQPESGALSVDCATREFVWRAGGSNAPRIVGRVLVDDNDAWLRRALDADVAQTRVLYRMIGSRRRWYVQLVMVGTPPVDPHLSRRCGTVGVDVGIRHVAVVSDDAALLADFAPTMLAREAARDGRVLDERAGDRVKRDRYCRRLARAIARKRVRHPANVGAVATQKKTLVHTRDGKAVGKEVDVPAGFMRGARLVTSVAVRQARDRLADIARVDALARGHDHGRLANVILTMGDRIVLERLSYVGFQKAFGRQTRRFSPGAFAARLAWRARVIGASVIDIPTSLKLSQLCTCGRAVKTPIRGAIAHRMKPACECGRPAVHRDGYSAFLARFAAEGTSVDLVAASAASTRALELVAIASTAYDTAEAPRIPRVAPASEKTLCAVAIEVRAGAAPPPSSTTARASAASVRSPAFAADDGRILERLGDESSPHSCSNDRARASLRDRGSLAASLSHEQHHRSHDPPESRASW